MPVSVQLVRERHLIHVRHALKEGNLRGMARWAFQLGGATDPRRLVRRIFADALRQGGVLHLWGHSWEIEENGLWGILEETLDAVAGRPGIDYLTNSETLSAVG